MNANQEAILDDILAYGSIEYSDRNVAYITKLLEAYAAEAIADLESDDD